MKHTELPTVKKLAADLERSPIRDLLSQLEDLPAPRIPALLSQLAAAQAMLAARLLAGEDRKNRTEVADQRRLITAEEAADRTGMSADYFYRRGRSLPFAIKIGRSLRFSETGLERWIQSRIGRQQG